MYFIMTKESTVQEDIRTLMCLSASKYINPKLIEMEGNIYKFSYS